MKLKELWKNKKYRYMIIGGGIAILALFVLLLQQKQPAPAQPTQKEETPVVEKNYQEWKDKNPDFYGWLQIEGTTIDYPVMYKDNEYYLNHTFDQEEDIYGTPFVDARNHLDPRDTNLLIHGHSTLAGPEGKMFDDLLSYREEAFYQDHPKIHFDTLEENAEYEIIMVIESRVMYKNETNYRYYNFLNVENEEEWNEQIEELKQLRLYDTGVEAAYGDELITLSTCDYTRENGRLAVIAKKDHKIKKVMSL